jgi:hypothetical protein
MQLLPFSNPFNLSSPAEFSDFALSLFQRQYRLNKVYQEYCNYLKVIPEKVDSIKKIPFLPVSFFKTHRVVTGDFTPQITFFSSSTTGTQASRHEIKDIQLYETSFIKSFEYFYGNPHSYTFLALLPSYLEREGSSLIYMIEKLMQLSGKKENGFFLYDYEQLFITLTKLKKKREKTILFGVTFALLDFIKNYHIYFQELIIFETGGMKGRGKEFVKEEVHHLLQEAFHLQNIHSEYGMCELLSQAYSTGNNVFKTPPWMKFLLRDEKNPLHVSATFSEGGINVIDLANIHSCAFIATDDLGRRHRHGLEITGRFDHAEVRGCNLLVF